MSCVLQSVLFLPIECKTANHYSGNAIRSSTDKQHHKPTPPPPLPNHSNCSGTDLSELSKPSSAKLIQNYHHTEEDVQQFGDLSSKVSLNNLVLKIGLAIVHLFASLGLN